TKTQASGAEPPVTAALKPVCPVRRCRTEGSACRPRESPRTRISGPRFSLAIRLSFAERSVGAAASAETAPSATVTSRRTAIRLISELEVDERVRLGDGHDRERSCGTEGETVPDARPDPDLPGVRRDVDEQEQGAEQQAELDREQRADLCRAVEAVQAEHRAEDVPRHVQAG